MHSDLAAVTAFYLLRRQGWDNPSIFESFQKSISGMVQWWRVWSSYVKLKLSRNVRTFPPGRWKIQMKALKRLNPLCGQVSCWDGSKMQAGTKLAWMSWIRLELTMITMGSWLCRVAFWIIWMRWTVDPCHNTSPLGLRRGLSYRLGSSAAGEFVFCLVRLPEQTAQAKLGWIGVFIGDFEVVKFAQQGITC